MNTTVDDYFRKLKKWQEELILLRSVALDCGLSEELKWAKPCYMFRENNIAILQGFKESCAILFPKGALLKDPHGLLEKPGENTQAARRVVFKSVEDVRTKKSALKAFIKEAIDVEKAGLKVNFKKIDEFAIPEELQRALSEHPNVKSAFNQLTPGRQRAYIMHFSAPKQSKTRESRVEKCIPKILEGKGLND